MSDDALQLPPEGNEQDENLASPQPSYKRRRIALACTSCRNRKSRCNGGKPSCSLCVELGFECFYQQPATGNVKAFLQPDSQDQRLRNIEETLRLLVEQQGSAVERGVQQPPSTQPPVAPRSTDQTPAAEPTHLSQHGEDVALLKDDVSSMEGVDDTVDGMAAITDTEGTDVRFFGPSSNITLLRQISDATSAILNAGGLHSSSHASGRSIVSRLSSPDATTTTETKYVGQRQVNTRSLPSEERVLHLIKLFFSDTGMLFPYIHEQHLLRTYSAAHRNRFAAVSRSWLSLMNVIFAFATYLSAHPDRTAEQNAAESDIFITRAQILSSMIEMRTATLETVQCFLLMAQYRQGTQRPDLAWDLHGFAVRAAIQLGLHSRSASVSHSAIEAEMRKRTWFGCMIVDRTLSMTFGRPLTVPHAMLKLDLPLEPRSGQQTATYNASASRRLRDHPDTVCFFVATIELYYILGDIIEEQYGGNVDLDPLMDLAASVQRTVSLERRLTAWKQNLPTCLLREPWAIPESTARSTSLEDRAFNKLSVIIMLRYLNARILLHRPALLLSLQQNASCATVEEVPVVEESFCDGLAAASGQACRHAAMDIVEIVQKMSMTPALLGAWWFTSYYTFNAALVLYSCILLSLSRNKNTMSRSSFGSASRHSDAAGVANMINRLRQAAQTLRKLGEGTKPAKRIVRALEKLVQISLTLVQIHPECAPATMTALTSNFEGATYRAANHDRNTRQEQGPHPVVDVLALMPNDPFTAIDPSMYQYWSGGNLDLFSDLGGFEPGLTW